MVRTGTPNVLWPRNLLSIQTPSHLSHLSQLSQLSQLKDQVGSRQLRFGHQFALESMPRSPLASSLNWLRRNFRQLWLFQSFPIFSTFPLNDSMYFNVKHMFCTNLAKSAKCAVQRWIQKIHCQWLTLSSFWSSPKRSLDDCGTIWTVAHLYAFNLPSSHLHKSHGRAVCWRKRRKRETKIMSSRYFGLVQWLGWFTDCLTRRLQPTVHRRSMVGAGVVAQGYCKTSSMYWATCWDAPSLQH